MHLGGIVSAPPSAPPAPPEVPIARSIVAVVAGFLYIGALAVGADLLLRWFVPGAFSADGRVEATAVLLLMQGYVGLFAVSGCYLAARWAGRAPMRHALALGALRLVFNGAGTVAMWHTAPAWSHVVALALVLPYAWAGGWLREREVAGAASPAAAMPAA